jgi:hypothetical protein
MAAVQLVCITLITYDGIMLLSTDTRQQFVREVMRDLQQDSGVVDSEKLPAHRQMEEQSMNLQPLLLYIII